MNGDDLIINDSNPILISDSIMINYGACKPKEEQEVKLLRRERAWKSGLRKGTGRHYIKGKIRNWIYDKKDYIDIRNTDKYKFVQRIIDESR